jgi:hypothetical protein
MKKNIIPTSSAIIICFLFLAQANLTAPAQNSQIHFRNPLIDWGAFKNETPVIKDQAKIAKLAKENIHHLWLAPWFCL